MRKSFLFSLVICLGVFIGSSQASIYHIDIMGLSDVYGFGADIETSATVGINDFTLENGNAVPSHSTISFWNIWIVSAPTLGVQGVQYIYDGTPLSDGTIVTVSGDFDFELTNFRLGGNTTTGIYPGEFVVNFDENTSTYTFAAIPIPTTILILGGGLIGILGVRRKMKLPEASCGVSKRNCAVAIPT